MEPLKNVTREAKTRQKFSKNRSLHVVNEDFEKIFNAVFASIVVFQRLLYCNAEARHATRFKTQRHQRSVLMFTSYTE